MRTVYRFTAETAKIADWVAERADSNPSRPFVSRTLTLNGTTQSYRRPTGFQLRPERCVCLPAKDQADMRYNGFKLENQKPGGRIHRSTRASREELLAMIPAGRGRRLAMARRRLN